MSQTAQPSAPRLVPLGEIVAPHGVKGLLRFHPYNAASAAALTGRPTFLAPASVADAADAAHPIHIVEARPHGNVVLLRVEDVGDANAAATLVGRTIAVDAADLPAAAPGEYYAYQLEGLDVVTAAGDRLGAVTSVMPTGSNDVLVVRDGRHERLIPVIADVVRDVDLTGRRIVIEPLAGLLD